MDPATLTLFSGFIAVLKDGGPWALVVALGWWAQNRDSKLEASREARRLDTEKHAATLKADAKDYADRLNTLLERVASVLERAAGTMATVTAALESRTSIFERLIGVVDETKGLIRDLQAQSVTADTLTRATLDASIARLGELVRAVEAVKSELKS